MRSFGRRKTVNHKSLVRHIRLIRPIRLIRLISPIGRISLIGMSAEHAIDGRLAARRQMMTFFLKYVSRNSVGGQLFFRLNMRLKFDRLLKPQS